MPLVQVEVPEEVLQQVPGGCKLVLMAPPSGTPFFDGRVFSKSCISLKPYLLCLVPEWRDATPQDVCDEILGAKKRQWRFRDCETEEWGNENYRCVGYDNDHSFPFIDIDGVNWPFAQVKCDD